MEAKLQRRLQRYGWDKSAPFYEKYWQQQLEPAQTRLLALANLQPGEQVLDVACGTGLVTLRAATEVSPSGAVIGTDISEAMVAAARKVANRQKVMQVAFQRMEAEALQFADNSFDVVLCSLGLMYIPDPLKALTEMFRVLRPGGRVVTAVWGQRNRCGWNAIFPIVDARVRSEVCPLFFQLGTHGVLRQTCQAAGFTDVLSERLAIQFHRRSLWGGLCWWPGRPGLLSL